MKLPRPSRFEVGYFLILLLLVVIVFYFSYRFRDDERVIQSIENQQPVVIKGVNGVDGKNGTNGTNGINATSVDTIVEHDTTVVTNTQEAIPGPQGEQGQVGPAAAQLEFCYESDGTLGQKYVGDRDCQPITTDSGTDD